MITITGITSNPIQTLRIPVGNGSRATMKLIYRATSQMWFMDLAYTKSNGTHFTINGIRLCNNINLLRQYRNRIPFGMLIFCPDETEPFLINDFSTGRCTINILTQAEVDQIEAAFIGAS